MTLKQQLRLWKRWRIYRRWGRRKSWNGNEIIDIELKQRGDWWTAEGWSVCRCRKQFHAIAGAPSEREVRLRLQMSDGLCRACQAWMHKLDNRCPDGNCQLSYWHKGRCVPYTIPAELRAKMVAELTQPKPKANVQQKEEEAT